MKKHDAWLEKARRDYEVAYKLLENKDHPYIPEALYHAQQSVEKSLKGFLVFHDIGPERTHQLEILLKACIRIDPTFVCFSKHARELSNFAVDTRYPEDDFVVPFLPTALQYVDDAKTVYDFVQKAINR